ncbi:MAG: Na(+)/H(+) antiporter subunit D [Deltaproteobacteria bacterium]|nr:Na(+)/H(+) antiporter subunit D [Deltaproteobacteria bacterium]
MTNWIHPGAILILGSILIPFLPGRIKKAYLLLLPALAFISVLTMHEGTYWAWHFLGQDMVVGRVDKLSIVFAYVFSVTTFITMVYGLHVEDDGHHAAAFVYAGSALGVAFAGDFLTLIIFWEFMAFSSMLLVLYRRTKKAYAAGMRYILVHISGGVCLMAGVFLQYSQTHSLAFNHVEVGGLAAGLILIGFILNAAVPPLGAWLPDAYPEATVSGAVFMAAFTTKSAVYALIRGFAGAEVLLWLGVIMACYGIIYTIIENDIRRLLSYHIISQVGYMVAAIGIGTEMAINGAAAHAFTNILYKGLLFMGMGSVLHVTGKSKATELGGIYRHMPLTFIHYMIAGFSISGVPLFAGFVTKSMIISAAGEEHLPYVWLVLTLVSAGTFLSTTLKLPYATFMGKDRGIEAKEPPLNMLLGMALAACLCILIGVYPHFLYRLLPYAVDYKPYTHEHLVWAGQILLFTWLGFYLYMKKLHTEQTISIDTDWFYRKGALVFMNFAGEVVAGVDSIVSEAYNKVFLRFGAWVSALSFRFDKGVIDGILDGLGRRTSVWGPVFTSRNARFDSDVVDGAVNGVAGSVVSLASSMRRFQTGHIHDYAFAILAGLLVLLNVFFLLS